MSLHFQNRYVDARIPLQSEKRSFGTVFLTARNYGVIAPGNHWIYDSLRGAPLPGRSDFALRAGTPGTAFPTGFISTHAAPTRRGDSQIARRRNAAQNRFPRGWCSAQRIYNPMIAGGNHTTIPSCQKNGPKGPFF